MDTIPKHEFQRDEELKQFLNRTFPYDPKAHLQKDFPNFPKTSQYTNFALLTQLCEDKDLQKQVHDKLIEWSSQTKFPISGEQLKPKHFYDFLPKLKDYLDKGPKEESSESSEENDYVPLYENEPDPLKSLAWVINFGINPEDYEIADIWAVDITKQEDQYLAGTPGSMYNYDAIIFESIAGSETIQEYGHVGFIAALLLFFHWDIIAPDQKTLLELTMEYFARQLNACTPENFDATLSHITPDILDKQYFRKLLDEKLQIKLFNEYDDGDGFIRMYDPDGKPVGKKWYLIVFGKFIVTKIETTVTRTFIFNHDLEVIGHEDS